VSCEGETASDVELIGPISYWPIPGFPGYFFPFENSEGYLSPLVAIHFKRPASKCLVSVLTIIKNKLNVFIYFVFLIQRVLPLMYCAKHGQKILFIK